MADRRTRGQAMLVVKGKNGNRKFGQLEKSATKNERVGNMATQN